MICIIQIALLMPLLNVVFPANALKFFKILIPIVNFDLLESMEWYNDILVKVSRLSY
jgi:hypothetical protein